jgi:hypothetical protein
VEDRVLLFASPVEYARAPTFIFRVKAFNFLNHPNRDVPVTSLNDSTFGQLQIHAARTIGATN